METNALADSNRAGNRLVVAHAFELDIEAIALTGPTQADQVSVAAAGGRA